MDQHVVQANEATERTVRAQPKKATVLDELIWAANRMKVVDKDYTILARIVNEYSLNQTSLGDMEVEMSDSSRRLESACRAFLNL